MTGSTAKWWTAWATTAQSCPPIVTSLVASGRAQEGSYHLSSAFAHPSLLLGGKARAKRSAGSGATTARLRSRAAGQQPATFCSLLRSTEEGFCAALAALSPPGLAPLPAAPTSPVSLPTTSRDRCAPAGRPFSLTRACSWRGTRGSAVSGSGLSQHCSPTLLPCQMPAGLKRCCSLVLHHLPSLATFLVVLLAMTLAPLHGWPCIGCSSWLACAAHPGDIVVALRRLSMSSGGGGGAPASPQQTVFLVGQASKAAVGWGVQWEGQEYGDIVLGSYRTRTAASP